MRKNIAACTVFGSNYPAYISVNTIEDRPDYAEVTLRGDAYGEKCGSQVIGTFHRDEITAFALELLKNL